MKVQKANILGKETIQIYISRTEEKKEDIQEKIKTIKENSNNVVIFVAGKEDVARTLQYIINKQAKQTASCI